uniref:Non-structural maintenance of chromosomes element 4 n=1 Tax=Setaria digitata TaxID=48799 RepID=A0A915PVL2_9BILA
MRERNGETRSVTGISKELSQSPKNKTTNTEENETTNEIETMNKLLDEMKKESEKRTEIRKFIFDKNFEKKIKTCINMRAEIDAYAAECETIIQSETLITKPVQTATASEIFTILPMEQQLPTIKHFVGACKATHVILPKKNENEQISIEHVDSAGKKMVKGFGEVALTKVGHWSKSAFNFFRIKNISSGKDATVSRKSQKKTSNAGTDNSGQYVKDEEIERPRENLKPPETTTIAPASLKKKKRLKHMYNIGGKTRDERISQRHTETRNEAKINRGKLG